MLPQSVVANAEWRELPIPLYFAGNVLHLVIENIEGN